MVFHQSIKQIFISFLETDSLNRSRLFLLKRASETTTLFVYILNFFLSIFIKFSVKILLTIFFHPQSQLDFAHDWIYEW